MNVIVKLLHIEVKIIGKPTIFNFLMTNKIQTAKNFESTFPTQKVDELLKYKWFSLRHLW